MRTSCHSSSARLSAGVFADAAMHTPVEVTERAHGGLCRGPEPTASSRFGGGSTIGLGKAIAYRNDAPQIVVADDLCRAPR